MEIAVNIVCFYWRGSDRPGWEDPALGVEYVSRLYHGVRRNLSLPFRFVCFTNEPGEFARGVEIRELKPLSWLGCLPKLEAHNPANGFRGRVLVFDLDTVIVGDLGDFTRYDGPFATRAWFKGMRRGLWLSGGDLLGFKAGETAWIWERYASDPSAVERFTGGRERYVYRHWCKELRYWQEELPGQLVSYKHHVRRGGLPANARVVSCHGNPRPHEIDEPWINKHWRNGDD